MKERGQYQTKQQEAVAAFFQAEPAGCLTAEEVYRRLSEKGLDVGKTTVYRAISRLCEAGRLRRYAPHDNGEAAQYQWNPCHDDHLHIRCTHCGALEHLSCEEVRAFCGHIASHHGFVLNESQTILYGSCRTCAQAADGQKEEQK